jgi:hypothetical protein
MKGGSIGYWRVSSRGPLVGGKGFAAISVISVHVASRQGWPSSSC